MLPKDIPPFPAARKFFCRWRDLGLLEQVRHHFLFEAREAAGRSPQPTESGAISGYGAGRKVNGRSRPLASADSQSVKSTESAQYQGTAPAGR